MRGYDGGKKIKGRKRHIAVDTLGFLLCVVVHAASISDTRGARTLMLRMHRQFPGLVKIFVDGGYKKGCITWAATMLGWTLEVVKRIGDGFHILPKRWIVERTFAWIANYRLHAKDYHHNPRHAEAALYATSTRILLQRLAKI